MDFQIIKLAVAKQFEFMVKNAQNGLHRTNVQKDALWETYLSSFSPEDNPIFKTRTEHDCNCCKGFVRVVGNTVAIIDGKLVSIWDVTLKEPGYQKVADAMAALVKAAPIENKFLHFEKTAGTDKTFVDAINGVKAWNHFFVNVPAQYVRKNADIASELGKFKSFHDVFLRGMKEIKADAISAVLELIASNSIYRGEEHKANVLAFQKLKAEFDKVPAELQDNFVWANLQNMSGAIRNTVIGTLLVDLSDGKDLEDAVKSFEAKVAPANYKRPKALVTKAMIENARKTVEGLGLTSALERRYAALEDITINNVLFADRSAKKVMSNVFDDLTSEVKVNAKAFDKVEEVPIDKFLKDVLPLAKSLELMVENRHTSNLVSLIAPVDPTAASLFKWDNNFSWTYNGDVADSLREKVAAAGGRVDGVLRFSHSWNHVGRNASLMDLHVFMPGSSKHVDTCHDRYPTGQRVGWNQRNDPASGGIQDVDYVKPAPEGYVPVENITFPSLNRLKEGTYTFKIHNWSLRQPTNSGFKAEIEFEGQVFEYDHPRPLKQKEWVTVAVATLKDGHFTIEHKIPHGASSRKIWGLTTHTFQKVNVVMMSPNFWDGQGSGNRHVFFMLDGCVNEGTARGFYNEFLNDALTPHRKVIEMVGAKMKTDASDKQLSGLGFSSTQRNSVLCKVQGSSSRVIKIVF